MIYFDCVNKTVLFIANSGQTIPRNNPTESSTNSTELLFTQSKYIIKISFISFQRTCIFLFDSGSYSVCFIKH